MPHVADDILDPKRATNSEGKVLEFERGSAPVPSSGGGGGSKSWAIQTHPHRHDIVLDELKQRASYIVDRRRLAPFLVPHRFEASGERNEKGQPTNLALRRKLAYGIGLNQAYLSEVMGHIRRAQVSRAWGPLDEGDAATTGEPASGTAALLWRDATFRGLRRRNWRNFFSGHVLEWMLTAPGGKILVDAPGERADSRTDSDRPFCRFIPWSWIEDWAFGDNGLRAIKIRETRDRRDLRRTDQENGGFQRIHLLYELDEASGTITVDRVDDDGESVEETRELDPVMDVDGRFMLPFVDVAFGEHPDAEEAGSGLLRGLDDIVLDLWNLTSEMREEFRDIVFSFLAYSGSNFDTVKDQLLGGSRVVNLGAQNSMDKTALELIQASGTGVEAGELLFRLALTAWSLTAKRKAQEAVEVGGPRSGKSIEAEFEVDIKPLLASIAGELDDIERRSMFLAAQMAGTSEPDPESIKVERSTDFRVEDEATRIARLVDEARGAGIPIAPTAERILANRWYVAVDLETDDEPPDGVEGATLGEVLDRETETAINQRTTERRNRALAFGDFPPLSDTE